MGKMGMTVLSFVLMIFAETTENHKMLLRV